MRNWLFIGRASCSSPGHLQGALGLRWALTGKVGALRDDPRGAGSDTAPVAAVGPSCAMWGYRNSVFLSPQLHYQHAKPSVDKPESLARRDFSGLVMALS